MPLLFHLGFARVKGPIVVYRRRNFDMRWMAQRDWSEFRRISSVPPHLPPYISPPSSLACTTHLPPHSSTFHCSREKHHLLCGIDRATTQHSANVTLHSSTSLVKRQLSTEEGARPTGSISDNYRNYERSPSMMDIVMNLVGSATDAVGHTVSWP